MEEDRKSRTARRVLLSLTEGSYYNVSESKRIESMSLRILYGSQTGNAEDIARDLASRCEEQLGLTDILCDTLNSQKKLIPEFKDSVKLLVIVCSTTGNGDAPENAESFWRSTKLRSAAKDLYAGINYTVLGLGDTNYDKFCYMGKSFHKRLQELGGNPILELHCADEATGLEEVVEEWVTKAMELIKSVFIDDGGANTAAGVPTTSSSATEAPEEESNNNEETATETVFAKLSVEDNETGKPEKEAEEATAA